MSYNNNVGNTALRDLLSSVKIKTRKEYRDYPNPFITELNELGLDGVDHINISQHGNSELGKALANETPIPVDHPLFGKFRSVTGFWYYIKSKERNNKCRKLVGRGLKELSKTLTLSHVKNFRAIILDTVWLKIQQNPAIGEVLVSNELPIECYYEEKGTSVKKRLNYASWFVCGINDIREALIKGVSPDFSEYLDVKGSDIYEFINILTTMSVDDELRYLLSNLSDNQEEVPHTESDSSIVEENDVVEETDTKVESEEEPRVDKGGFSFAEKIVKLMEEKNDSSYFVEDAEVPDPYMDDDIPLFDPSSKPITGDDIPF